MSIRRQDRSRPSWRPHQVWLDGIWFTLPFYAHYGQRFGEPAFFDESGRAQLAGTR
ncbi:MAG TPA: glycoside hydrolase family 88 protein [Steroidobacteraceae bacterium]|nr:glycoside hydrolase family 88 protein [Steroidobacteraceae bacterium]